MRDKELYARILGVRAPWQVEQVELDEKGVEVRVLIRIPTGTRLSCPNCGESCAGYDT